ncbi:Patatin-like phospholipase domain-containing protein 4 [Toxocara canis]|uniref:Patatin-like phospholipase domain-containing protein 4 n=1 Tax=Toxocara canis TaxID=6265 RepID=A0A0B2VGG4_TOXCA|nr:Patatin-like phospholipase domain-containing protein 4 [Toxocara canis]
MKYLFVADSAEVALSFSGCGFLGTYHFGVISCLTHNGMPILQRMKRCAGASAGSLVAALLVLAPSKAKEGLNMMYALAEELNTLRFGAITPGFLLSERLTKIVDEHIPEDIAPAQGKLFISLTHQKKRKNLLVSRYSSREHLIKCLAASCFIPMYSMGFDAFAVPPIIDNEPYIDGGYTNNLPEFNDMPTITISPFSGSACIAPHDGNPLVPFFEWRMTLGNQEMNVNMQNIVRGAQALFPPSIEVLKGYFEMGFRDALKFLIENDP